MKSIVLSFLLLAFFQLSFAQQRTDTPPWTVGATILSQQHRDLSVFTPVKPMTGVFVKRDISVITLRGALEYVKFIDKKDEPQCCDIMYSEGYNSEGTLRIGIEKGTDISRLFRIYGGVDLILMGSYSETTHDGGFDGTHYDKTARSWGYGLAPLGGFEVSFSRRLSAGLEFQWRCIKMRGEADYVYLVDRGEATHREINRSMFNGVGLLSFQYKL